MTAPAIAPVAGAHADERERAPRRCSLVRVNGIPEAGKTSAVQLPGISPDVASALLFPWDPE